MPRRPVALLAAAAALLAALSPVSSASAAALAAAARAVSSLPVTFTVQNTNRSVFSCPSDGRTYTVSGHIVGPAAQLTKTTPTTGVTLYLHGLNFGEFFWDFDAPGYNYAQTQAEAGQTSVVVDRIGYGGSGKPDGNAVCVGSQADIAHQMVLALRSGSYQVGAAVAPRFSRVALAGHSYGGQIAELEAYSFHDIDALVVMAYTDQGATSFATKSSNYTAKVCAAGGLPAVPGGPTGYAPFGNPADARPGFFHDVTPAIFDAVKPRLSLNPCGDMVPFGTASVVNAALVGLITVPVLLVSGAADKLFPPAAAQRQVLLYTGSPEVTLQTIDHTAHSLSLEKTRKTLASVVRSWLNTTTVK